MKKIFKFFLIIPILLITSIFSFGCSCSDDSLTSIELSLTGYEIVSGYYSVEKTDKSITINTKLNSDKYSVDDLEWTSSATDIVTVYKNSFKTKGAGKATITATYTDKSGNKIKGIIRVWITEDSALMSFENKNNTATYSGKEIHNNYKILQDEGNDQFGYYYISLTTGKIVDKIINAGEYQLYCYRKDNPDIYCMASLIVNKYEITLDDLGNYEMVYGDNLPSGLIYKSNLNAEVMEDASTIEGINGEGVIAKYIYTVENSSVNYGKYTTSLYFEFSQASENQVEFEKNYYITNTNGQLNIKSREVVLQINDNTITYGDGVSTTFKLYDFDTFGKNNNALDNKFNSNVNLKTPSYYYQGVQKQNNNVGCLPVLIKEGKTNEYDSYELKYEGATANNNLTIKTILSGKLTIQPRQVTILPSANQFKNYLDKDISIKYSSVVNSFIPGEKINEFLFVDYLGQFGTLNYKAEVGNYFYKILETSENNVLLNPNYKIFLDDRAVEGKINLEEKYKFSVKQITMEFEVNSVEEKFKSPSDTENKIHTLSYFTNSNYFPDYTTSIKNIKINNKNVDVSILNSLIEEDWDGIIGLKYNVEGIASIVEIERDSEGNIIQPSDENNELIFSVKLDLKLSATQNENFYNSYNISLISFAYEEENRENVNVVLVDGAKLNLKKLYLTVTPKMTYDYVNIIYGDKIPDRFPADFVLSGEIELGDTVSDILKNFSSVIKLKELQLTSENSPVGKYEICLNELEYKPGKEYYDIKLDDSQKYYFTINPYKVLVEPKESQKIYGEKDAKFEYAVKSFYDNKIELNNLPATGYLTRMSGENVGSYKITLGNLSFGSNYEIIFVENINFTISQRVVTVTPTSYISTYGDEINKGYSIFIQDGYDSQVLQLPTFTGSFRLGKQKGVANGDFIEVEYASTLGGHFPVLISDNGDVLSYSIGIGDFKCNDNYLLNFANKQSTYTINPKEIIINLATSSITSKDGLSNKTTLIGPDISAFTLIDAYTGEQLEDVKSKLTLNLDLTNDYFVSGSKDKIEIFSTKYDVDKDLSHCYDVKIGNNIVYNVNVTVLNFEILYNNNGTLTNSFEKVYDAINFNDFRLVCRNEGYVIGDQSVFSITYSKGGSSYNSVVNAGNYVANLNLNIDGAKIVIIKNAHTCDEDCVEECAEKLKDDSHICDEDCIKVCQEKAKEKIIEFSTFNGDVVDNHLPVLLDYGYVNIKKANITYDASKLKFEENLVYGSNELSNISTKDEEGNDIFLGVDSSKLNLKDFDSTNLNFHYNSSSYLLSSLNANSSYPINVVIQAENTNYNPISVNVPLHVIPKVICVVPEIDYSNKDMQNGYVVYDGITKTYFMNVYDYEDYVKYDDIKKVPKCEEIQVNISYEKFFVSYNKSTNGIIDCYLANGDSPDTNEKRSLESSTLLSLNSLEYKNNYLFVTINQEKICIPVEKINTNPCNAGVYLCNFNFQSSDNYLMKFPKQINGKVITYDDGNENAVGLQSNFEIFEIKKSSALQVNNWKDSFYYTTSFNVENKETLPFEFEISPNYKDYVNYSIKDFDGNAILNVGEYTVALSVEVENYYFTKNFNFKVESLRAEFVFPVAKTYVYTGKSIQSFLNGVRINQLDKDGNVISSFYYEEELHEDVITITYFNEDGSVYEDETGDYPAPYQVSSKGKFYTLKMEYAYADESKQTNFKGEGTFEYAIIKKSFSGSISFENNSITYSPDLTATEVYEFIENKMFSISLEEDEYSVEFYYLGMKIDKNSNAQWFKRFLNDTTDDVNEKKIIAKIKFLGPDGDSQSSQFEEKSIETILSVIAKSIDKSRFVQATTSESFSYTGYQVYKTLNYKPEEFDTSKISLNPLDSYFTETIKEKIITLSENGKTIKFTLIKDSDVQMTLKDKFGNTIFTISYSFEKDTGNASWEEYSSIPRDPARYKAIYNVVFGKYYAANNIRDFEESKIYNINKVTLNLLAKEATEEYIYNGSSFTEAVLTRLVVSNNSALTSSSNMKYITTSTTHNSADGVHLNYRIEKLNDAGNKYEVVSNNATINAGSYKIKVILFVNINYNLSDYFENVNFGHGNINISNFIGKSVAELYNDNSLNLSFEFTVQKKKIDVPFQLSDSSINLLNKEFEIDDSTELIVKSINFGVNNIQIIKVNDDTTEEVVLNSDSQTIINYNFVNLDVGNYYIKYTIDTKNCEWVNNFSEGKITFVINQVETDESE